MPLQATGPEGEVLNMMVTQVNRGSIQVDANHPLAERQLNFDIELVAPMWDEQAVLAQTAEALGGIDPGFHLRFHLLLRV